MFEHPKRPESLALIATRRINDLRDTIEENKLFFLREGSPLPSIAFSFDPIIPFEPSFRDVHHSHNGTIATAEAWTSAGGVHSKYYEKNEDAFLTIETPSFFASVVVDGAGGTEDGAVASRLAIMETAAMLLDEAVFIRLGSTSFEAITESHLTHRLLVRLMRSLDERTAEWNAVNGTNLNGADGTIAGLLRFKAKTGFRTFVFARGDARIIQLRQGGIVPEGTTWFMNRSGYAALQKNKPEEYWKMRDTQHLLLTSISSELPDPSSKIYHHFSAQEIEASSGDRFVLYSDGVGDLVTDFEIERRAKTHFVRASKLCMFHDQLVALAQRRNESGEEGVTLALSKEDETSFVLNGPVWVDGRMLLRPAADNQTLISVEIR